jgi:hypothetical protein
LKKYLTVAFCAVVLVAGASKTEEISAPEQAALDRISAASMRGNLSFLASDALEGRNTPSHGLDVAAEFIAAQFRRAGLEPAGGDGSYFQTARFAEVTPHLDDFHMTLKAGGNELTLAGPDVRVHALRPIDLTDVPVVDLPSGGALPDMAGKVVAGDARRYGTEPALGQLQSRKPALILLMSRRQQGRGGNEPFLEDTDSSQAPTIRIANADATAAVGDNKPISVSLHLAAPTAKSAPVENVIGVFPGSDPVLRNQYVILSAHYDHLGMRGSQIYNGANDNGSGTVSVIEIAAALATLDPHPRRTIIFMTFFGEEEGLLGSYYYTHHPLFPLKATVANINLEQMGRTDDKDATHIASFSFTGPSYSNLPAVMNGAAKQEGVGIYGKSDADQFFDRSDNYAFAQAGIVAHTAVVAYEYPDYHAPGDKWQKIDYANMAKVDRAVGAGVLVIADAPDPPKWSNAKATAPYRDAASQRRDQ